MAPDGRPSFDRIIPSVPMESNQNKGIPSATKMGEGKVLGVQETPWENLLLKGYRLMCRDLEALVGDPDNHFKETPERVVKTYREIFWGCSIDPSKVLKTFSETKYDQMIWVKDIPFVSYCRHHLWPFMGKMHFGYIPDQRVVGVSKIPRLVDILSARPQLQESLAENIVQEFDATIIPLGCGVVIEGTHTCMCARGARTNATMRTVALRGNFLSEPSTKQEFLEGIR